MAVAAGQIIDVDDVFRRMASATFTTNSGNITTTETSVGSVAASLVSGRTYAVWFHGAADTSVAADTADCRLREDSVSGTEMTLRRVYLHDASGRFPVVLYAEYTAVATAAKTFHATYVRGSGGGNIIRVASATIPTYLFVDYISG